MTPFQRANILEVWGERHAYDDFSLHLLPSNLWISGVKNLKFSEVAPY